MRSREIALLLGAPVVEGDGLVDASGGNGGDSPGDAFGTWGWSGGGGGGGRVKVFGSNSITGVVQAPGGVGGAIPPADDVSFAGEPGDDGTVGGGDDVPPEFSLLCI